MPVLPVNGNLPFLWVPVIHVIVFHRCLEVMGIVHVWVIIETVPVGGLTFPSGLGFGCQACGEACNKQAGHYPRTQHDRTPGWLPKRSISLLSQPRRLYPSKCEIIWFESLMIEFSAVGGMSPQPSIAHLSPQHGWFLNSSSKLSVHRPRR